jgi:hypothetical protein
MEKRGKININTVAVMDFSPKWGKVAFGTTRRTSFFQWWVFNALVFNYCGLQASWEKEGISIS